MNNLGIYIFDQTSDLDYEIEIISFNLLSALSWINFQGPIHLYCNTRYLETLKKWGVDTLYEYINTEILDNKSEHIDYKQYWAYSKFEVIKNIQYETPFTIIDTDLWLNRTLKFNEKLDVMMYHKENFHNNYKNDTYPDFDFMIPDNLKEMNFDKSLLPTNCAILHIRNSNFIKDWISLSEEISSYNTNIKIPNGNKSTKMCFVEQRLLPMLLAKNGYKYDTFISQIYQSHLAETQDGSEWLPTIDNSSDVDKENFDSIKHVWGLKKYLNYKEIREMVIIITINTISLYPIKDKPYTKLCEELKGIIQTLESHSLAS